MILGVLTVLPPDEPTETFFVAISILRAEVEFGPNSGRGELSLVIPI